MSQYERVGSIPSNFTLTVRWTNPNSSAAAKRLFSLPRLAPEVTRRVLEDAVISGRFDTILGQIEREQETHNGDLKDQEKTRQQ